MPDAVSKNQSLIRDELVATRQGLADGRVKLLKQHRDGSPGIQVCARLTDLLDGLVGQVVEAALREFGSQADAVRGSIALVAYGGYGRREMAPFSDVDLMLLHESGAAQPVSRLAQRLVKD
ncbi:MAG: hypothetical protein KDA92_08000, partial [Planctomycetales bacterium]|nr:hypothetical protein [Planctomycetales bacterium]